MKREKSFLRVLYQVNLKILPYFLTIIVNYFLLQIIK